MYRFLEMAFVEKSTEHVVPFVFFATLWWSIPTYSLKRFEYLIFQGICVLWFRWIGFARQKGLIIECSSGLNWSQLMNAVTTILSDLGISEQHAVREFAVFSASPKAVEFAHDCEAFARKYGMSFPDFEKRLHSQADEEFDEQDDYLA